MAETTTSITQTAESQAKVTEYQNSIDDLSQQRDSLLNDLDATEDPKQQELIVDHIEKINTQISQKKAGIMAETMSLFPCFPFALKTPIASKSIPSWGGQGSFDPNTKNPNNSIRKQAEDLIKDSVKSLLEAAKAPLVDVIKSFQESYRYIAEGLFGEVPTIDDVFEQVCKKAKEQYDSMDQNIKDTVDNDNNKTPYGNYELSSMAISGETSNFKCLPNTLIAQLPCAILAMVLQPVTDSLSTFWKPLFSILAGLGLKLGGKAGSDASGEDSTSSSTSSTSGAANDPDNIELTEGEGEAKLLDVSINTDKTMSWNASIPKSWPTKTRTGHGNAWGKVTRGKIYINDVYLDEFENANATSKTLKNAYGTGKHSLAVRKGDTVYVKLVSFDKSKKPAGPKSTIWNSPTTPRGQ